MLLYGLLPEIRFIKKNKYVMEKKSRTVKWHYTSELTKKEALVLMSAVLVHEVNLFIYCVAAVK